MGNLQTAVPYSVESTFPASAEPIFKKLTKKSLSEWSGCQVDSLPTEDIPGTTLQIPKHAIATPLKRIKGDFRLLQMWEGRVISIDIDNNEFTAVISDKTNPDLPDEQVTLSIEDVPKNDLQLLNKGAVFYWSIGYADYPGRPRTRESRIRFRRLPKWTHRELVKAREKGAELAKIFSSH